MHLPSWPQWQRAIRGPRGFRYPRGMTWDDGYRSDPEITNIGHIYASPEGVEYFVADPLGLITQELTRDEDCMPYREPERGHLLVSLHTHELDRTIVFDRMHGPKGLHSAFRCVRELTSPPKQDDDG
jgi:hypothetical protein